MTVSSVPVVAQALTAVLTSTVSPSATLACSATGGLVGVSVGDTVDVVVAVPDGLAVEPPAEAVPVQALASSTRALNEASPHMWRLGIQNTDTHATARLERMMATSAQPADIVNRSLIERSGNIFARSMSMFVSEQRKALAIEALAIRKLATGKSKNKAMDVQRILVAHFVQSAITQCVAMFLASTLGDDEDEDREWSVKQWALSLSLGPISGLFLVGRGIESIARRMLGLRIFPNNDLAGKAADDLIRGTKSMDELFNPDDAEDVMTSLDALSAAAGSVGSGLFGPAAGAVDVSANLAREAIKITKALSDEE